MTQPIKDFDAWKEAVKKAYPKEASRLQFKGRIEHGHDTISAEIRGEDRCYGVWDNDKEEGEILEASVMKASSFLARAKASA